MNLTSTVLRVVASDFPHGGLRRSILLAAADRLEHYEAALKSIAESQPATDEGDTAASIAAEALKETN